MRTLTVSNLAIYLPADIAQVPFGDPLSDVAITLASPGVVSAVGYNNPANGDAISFTLPVGGAGVLPAAITAGQVYYVVGANANGTFNVSATKGGAAINTAQAASGIVTAHLISQQQYGTRTPFKPGATVVVLNTTGGSLVLQGASDSNSGFSSAGVPNYGNPQGPGAFSTLATVPAGAAQEVVLNADWIRVSTAANLILLQN